jgi:hypothetical protein
MTRATAGIRRNAATNPQLNASAPTNAINPFARPGIEAGSKEYCTQDTKA